MEPLVKTTNPKPAVATESSWVDWLVDDFYPRYARQVWIVAGVIAAGLGGYLMWAGQSERSAARANKELGAAFVLLGQERLPEAEKALTDFIRGHSGLAQDKAYLCLGKVYYDQQKYDQSLEAYGKVKGSGKAPLILSGALHGRAACLMQKKEYEQAAGVLDEFLSKFMLRTGAPKEDLAGEEVVDLSPAVPDALLKQALCYRELGQPAKVKAVIEKLEKAYPGTREAADGQKLLALTE